MQYAGMDDFLTRGRGVLAKGPVAVIMAEDEVEIAGTLRHHLAAGFRSAVLFMPAELTPPEMPGVHAVPVDVHAPDALPDAVNRLMDAAAGSWLYAGYNAEYLFHPFCETRNIREMIAFHTEERREAALAYVVDLYAGDLTEHPDAVAPAAAFLDRSGYYALARHDPAEQGGAVRERQLDFFGGLRWRFEEHIPEARRKIDRIALFRAKAGLRIRPDFTLSDEEMNTYACPWHHNITLAVCSFRTAKALRTNPGSRYGIDSFLWYNSVPFQWTSQQLMDLGLMEPGQWF